MPPLVPVCTRSSLLATRSHAGRHCVLAVGMRFLAAGCVDSMRDAPPSEALPFGVTMTRLGAEGTVHPSLHGPSLLLQGDGAPRNAAFRARDRMGRLIVFVARQIEASDAVAFDGLGVNEGTAVVVDSAGVGTVYGGRAYLVHGAHPPDTLEPGTPLTYSDVQIVRLPEGTAYDFRDRPLDRAYERSVEAGSLSASPYHP